MLRNRHHQAGELGSRVEDWVRAGGRFNLSFFSTIDSKTMATFYECVELCQGGGGADRDGRWAAATPPREEELSPIL